MFRLGICTGKIYTIEDYHKGIDECCVIVVHGEPEDNKEYIKMMRKRNKKRCLRCKGCPEFKKGGFST